MNNIIEKFHPPGELRHRLLMEHSRQVADKAILIAERLQPAYELDLKFIEEAALLHDIGIHLTDAPAIGCYGKNPYLAHGYLGREILEKEGLPQHALVCERHIGVGLSCEEILAQQLPLPQRDMQPQTVSEQIIAYADLFFSKSVGKGERSFAQVRQSMERYGSAPLARLDQWHLLFGP